MSKNPYKVFSEIKGRRANNKEKRESVAADAAAAGCSSTPFDVTVRTIQAGIVEPYVFIIHTGSNNPDKDKIAKWEDGRMNFVINPGSNRESPVCNVKELFSANREDCVRVSRFLNAAIGEPEQLKIGVESNKLEIIKEALYIREITILYKYKFYRFPVNDYLYPHNPLLNKGGASYDDGCPPFVISRCGRATFLEEETNTAVREARLDELELRRKYLGWSDNTIEYVLPGSTKEEDYDKLPRYLKFKNARQKAFQMNLKRGANMMKKTVIENKIGKVFGKDTPEYFSSLEEFETLFIEQCEENKYDLGMVYDVLMIIKYWKTDEEFVRQNLAGINPARIHKISELPETWNDRSDFPEHVLAGANFQEELTAGRVFFIETNWLEVVGDGGSLMNILTGFDLPMIVCLSDCLFYWDRKDVLRPIAIRVEYKNGKEEATFWFPPPAQAEEDSHDYLSWMLAKMYFNSANMQIHAILTHFVKAHAVVETFAIATYRNLPRQHPIHKLLLPHVQGIIPINVQGRQFLTKAAGVMSALMSAGDKLWHLADVYMKQFRIDQLIFPEDIKKRGVEDIPGYHFRDDGMAWWKNLRQYCQEFLELHYTTDELVAGDSELLSFLDELRNIGFARIPERADFPDKITTVTELVDFITMIMWNSSVWHTAVNFGQFNYLAFIPNSPCSMTKAPPGQGDVITMERILTSLPVREMARVQIDISYSLSLFSPVEKFYLGSVREEKACLKTETTIVDEEEIACIDRLNERLSQMQTEMDKRNEGLNIPYVIIKPDLTPLTVQT